MTLAGFLFMSVSIGLVTGLFVWCLVRVLGSGKRPEHLARVEPVETEDLSRR